MVIFYSKRFIIQFKARPGDVRNYLSLFVFCLNAQKRVSVCPWGWRMRGWIK